MKPETGSPARTADLHRVIGPVGLTLYGVGVTLGAGIYALIGEMAGVAGMHVPLAFLFAGFLAGLTGLSYAELGSRYPESAGEAVYVQQGFRLKHLTSMAGYGVALSGCISAAVVLHGFAGYLHDYVDLPDIAVMAMVLVALTGVALWGVRESVWLAALITLAEGFGLVLILGVAAPDALAYEAPPFAARNDGLAAWPWAGLLAASVMAFFAFIGFEDIVNLAEEVKDPQRSLPIAILATLGISAVFYMAVSWVAVRVVSPQELAESSGPLVTVFQAATGRPGHILAAIALVAMINGALVQVLMASRVLYGLGKRGPGPAWLAFVSPSRKTPLWSTLIVAGLVFVLSLSGVLGGLAIAASAVTLIVFALVNAALLAVRRREARLDEAPFTAPHFRAPLWAPVVALLVSVFVVVVVAVTTVF